jgi:hypothetical protein
VRIPAHDWRQYPDNPSRMSPAAAGRDAIRAGDHVTAADAYLLQAAFEIGEAERGRALTAADVCARLSLRDAIHEATATLKEIAGRQIESTQDLDRTIQKATNAAVEELRRATVKEVA